MICSEYALTLYLRKIPAVIYVLKSTKIRNLRATPSCSRVSIVLATTFRTQHYFPRVNALYWHSCSNELSPSLKRTTLTTIAKDFSWCVRIWLSNQPTLKTSTPMRLTLLLTRTSVLTIWVNHYWDVYLRRLPAQSAQTLRTKISLKTRSNYPIFPPSWSKLPNKINQSQWNSSTKLSQHKVMTLTKPFGLLTDSTQSASRSNQPSTLLLSSIIAICYSTL